MTLGSTPAARRYKVAMGKLAAYRSGPRGDGTGWAPAKQLSEGAQALGGVMQASAPSPDSRPGIGPDELGAALALFEELRRQLDYLETQVIIEARRHGMDWSQIKDQQGLKTPQAAAQRYQRLMTRLEEIRQGVR